MKKLRKRGRNGEMIEAETFSGITSESSTGGDGRGKDIGGTGAAI